jgi:flagellar export protein FliJ
VSQRPTKRILHIKKLVERGKAAELAEASALRDVAEDRVRRAEAEHARVLGELSRERESSALDLADLARHVGMAAKVVKHQHALLAEELGREDVARANMHEATREVKTFERLDERKVEERKLMLRRYEQATADEVSSVRRRP